MRGTKRHERETDEANRLIDILRDAGLEAEFPYIKTNHVMVYRSPATGRIYRITIREEGG